MRFESSFEFDGDLIIVNAVVVGPHKRSRAVLVLDTGSSLTTLAPAIATTIGYSAEDRVARSVVRSAVGEVRGYIVHFAYVSALGFTVPDVPVNVAEICHGVDGLLGMDFLNNFNMEIRPVERRLIAERIAPPP